MKYMPSPTQRTKDAILNRLDSQRHQGDIFEIDVVDLDAPAGDMVTVRACIVVRENVFVLAYENGAGGRATTIPFNEALKSVGGGSM